MSLAYDPQALLAFHTQHLDTVLLPFWLDRSIDEEYGGYCTCFDNSGANLSSHDKFTWSQGRMVWVLAKLAAMERSTSSQRQRYTDLAASGAAFLMRHCLLDNGNCTFLMQRDGAPKEQVPGQGYDTSIYADCFVILGLSRYAATVGDRETLAFAQRLYRSVLRRLDTGVYRTEPYPTPEGYRAHGIPMIMLNLSQELAGALTAVGDPASVEVERRAEGYMLDVMDHFVEHDVVHEMISAENEPVADTLLGRYVNPGHTLEDMWFIMHQARARGNRAMIERATRIILKTMEIGWDQEYGGLLLFVDQEGGAPRGGTAGIENATMVAKIHNDWTNKLWWPHSEALYATLLAYTLTGDRRLFQLYEKVHDYTFGTFPNPDRSVGEWIQIRDRAGAPEQKVVALPVKDPFHIIRNLVLIIELLQGQASAPDRE